MKMFSKLAIEITEQYVAHLFKINHKTPKLPVFLVFVFRIHGRLSTILKTSNKSV